PAEGVWADLDKRFHQQQTRRAQAQSLLVEGESLCANGHFDSAVNVLRRAHQTAEGDPTVRKQVLAAVLSCAESALDSDWHWADVLIKLAVTLDPQAQISDELHTGLASRRRDGLVG